MQGLNPGLSAALAGGFCTTSAAWEALGQFLKEWMCFTPNTHQIVGRMRHMCGPYSD